MPQMRCLKARAAKTGPGVVGASSAMTSGSSVGSVSVDEAGSFFVIEEYIHLLLASGSWKATLALYLLQADLVR